MYQCNDTDDVRSCRMLGNSVLREFDERGEAYEADLARHKRRMKRKRSLSQARQSDDTEVNDDASQPRRSARLSAKESQSQYEMLISDESASCETSEFSADESDLRRASESDDVRQEFKVDFDDDELGDAINEKKKIFHIFNFPKMRVIRTYLISTLPLYFGYPLRLGMMLERGHQTPKAYTEKHYNGTPNQKQAMEFERLKIIARHLTGGARFGAFLDRYIAPAEVEWWRRLSSTLKPTFHRGDRLVSGEKRTLTDIDNCSQSLREWMDDQKEDTDSVEEIRTLQLNCSWQSERWRICPLKDETENRNNWAMVRLPEKSRRDDDDDGWRIVNIRRAIRTRTTPIMLEVQLFEVEIVRGGVSTVPGFEDERRRFDYDVAKCNEMLDANMLISGATIKPCHLKDLPAMSLAEQRKNLHLIDVGGVHFMSPLWSRMMKAYNDES